jgi:hypothetical protein
MAAVTESARGEALTFKTMGRVGTRFILQSPINGKLAAVSQGVINVLNQWGIQVEDKSDDYIL